MRKTSTTITSLLSVLLFLTISTVPATAAQSSQGLQDGWAIDNSCQVLFTPEVAAKIRESGAGWVRINFRLGGSKNWSETDTCQGVSALQLYDQVVTHAMDSGLDVVGLLSNESWPGDQTAWQENNAEMTGGNGDNAYLRDFSKMAAVPLAQHFHGKISTWEVWNEPNAYTAYSPGTGYTGSSFIYPSNFAWLLGHVYQDVRDAGFTGLQFVSGGLFGHDLGGLDTVVEGKVVTKRGDPMSTGFGTGPKNELHDALGARPPKDQAAISSGSAYLRATYEQGKANAGWNVIRALTGSFPLDGIGQHLYIDQDAATSARKIGSYLLDVRKAYVASEGKKTPKQTYITEVGWTTASVSEATQAANLGIAYDEFSATSYLHSACWFQLRDIAPSNLYFGLLTPFDPPWTEKPSWDAYRSSAAF